MPLTYYPLSIKIPGTVVNVMMERSVKNKNEKEDLTANKYINMFYYQFWVGVWTLTGTLALFWIALIPGVGTVPNIQMLGER